MSLVGCFVTPHPPLLIPEVASGKIAEVRATADAMRLLAARTASLEPDVVVIMSPHAPLDRSFMGLSAVDEHAGTFRSFGAPDVGFKASGGLELAGSIRQAAESAGVPVRAFATGRRVELDHGVLVPLVLLFSGASENPKLVVLSFSYLEPEAHVAFGRAVALAIDDSDARVLFVASGDLSHRLIPGAPAGFSPHGAEFDRSVVDAVGSADLGALLALPRDVVREAGECGLRSLFTMFGVLEGRRFDPEVLSYEGPFGVGYLVADMRLRGDDVAPSGEAHAGSASAAESGVQSGGLNSAESGAESGAAEHPLVALARRVVEGHVRGEGYVEPSLPPADSGERAGVFVSLHRPDGSLRGCVGTVAPTQPSLAEEVALNAVSAATRDPRFPPLASEELPGLRVAVDVLSEPEEVAGLGDLDPAHYGLIVRTDDGRQALLLPDLPGVDTAEQQLRVTCRKGRIDQKADRYRLFRFRVTRYGTH